MPSVKHGGGCVMVRKFHSPVPEADPNPRQVPPFNQLVFHQTPHSPASPSPPAASGRITFTPSTRSSYSTAWSSFTTFCAQISISLTTFNLQHLLAFMTDLRLSLNLASSSSRNSLRSGVQLPGQVQWRQTESGQGTGSVTREERNAGLETGPLFNSGAKAPPAINSITKLKIEVSSLKDRNDSLQEQLADSERDFLREQLKMVMSHNQVRTPHDVKRCYQLVLKVYKKVGSMARAFQECDVDRNTIAISAPIAELMIASPEAYHQLPEFDCNKENIRDFAKRCLVVMTGSVMANIKKLKSEAAGFNRAPQPPSIPYLKRLPSRAPLFHSLFRPSQRSSKRNLLGYPPLTAGVRQAPAVTSLATMGVQQAPIVAPSL
ncbi:UNVERIFIED_CONTAM: hypothetical protein FKN15_033100 [Acipenser sinensis]